MKTTLTNLRSPALIGLPFVLPFMVMELVNRWNYHEGFPVNLFGMMWLSAAAFVLILVPIVRNVRVGKDLMANPVSLLLRVVFLAFIARMWVGILIDQMPCFLGVPNCD
ncbi:MAG: hypothetical protein ACOYZ8_17230 [Chloroflexota bacterium]